MTVPPMSAGQAPDVTSTLLEAKQSGRLLPGLFDLRFRSIITTRMMPAIYGLIMVLAFVACTYLTVQAFAHSDARGLVWLLLLDPVIFLGTLVVSRIVLEFILVLFAVLVRLQQVSEAVSTIVGNTVEIVGNTDSIADQTAGLPRIPLTRGLRTLRESMQESFDKAAVQRATYAESGKAF